MTRSLYLVCLLGFFCLLSSAQLSDVEVVVEVEIDEQEFTNEEDVQLESDNPGAIQQALSQNIAKILQVLLDGTAQSIEDSVTNFSEEVSFEDQQSATIVSNVLRAIADDASVIGNPLGSLLRKAIGGFIDAEEEGQDGGDAAGQAVVDSLENIESEAETIGDEIQDDIDESIQNLENISEEDIIILEEFGGAVERFINSITAHSAAIGDAVNAAVDGAEGAEPIQLIGITLGNLIQTLSDNAESVGDAIGQAAADAMTGLDGLTQGDIDASKQEVSNTMTEAFQSIGISGSEAGDFINYLILQATVAGFHNEGPAKDEVDVINRIGDLYYDAFQKQFETGTQE